jgi:hypothetical protein
LSSAPLAGKTIGSDILPNRVLSSAVARVDIGVMGTSELRFITPELI